jgi:hypothetical protein
VGHKEWMAKGKLPCVRRYPRKRASVRRTPDQVRSNPNRVRPEDGGEWRRTRRKVKLEVVSPTKPSWPRKIGCCGKKQKRVFGCGGQTKHHSVLHRAFIFSFSAFKIFMKTPSEPPIRKFSVSIHLVDFRLSCSLPLFRKTTLA